MTNFSYQGLHKLDRLIFALNKPLVGKRGVHYQKLLKDWRLVVGEKLANLTIPLKITTTRKKDLSENILHIAANNPSILTELVYQVGVIKEQINYYFGYEYIQQIKFSQAVFTIDNNYEEPKSSKKIPEQRIEMAIAEYKQDDEIRKILTQMAETLLTK